MNKKFANLKNQIDLVYTWVDGNDPEWQKKKINLQNNITADERAVNKCRFVSNDELKYSLRSVEKYAPWINHIYIITDNQVPKWLNTNNPKITIINHTEIFPKDALPCFNSNAIEHCIINIPNLSEKFLYANDDTFFNNRISPNFFFARSGKAICRLGKKISDMKPCIYKQMLINAINCLKEKKYRFPEYRTHHNIDAYNKSTILECKAIFESEINDTVKNQFRTDKDIERLIYSLYAIAAKKARYKIVYQYPTNKSLIKKIIKFCLKGKANDSLFINLTNIDSVYRNLEIYKPKLICINDCEKTTDEARNLEKPLLERLFPEKSSFEK